MKRFKKKKKYKFPRMKEDTECLLIIKSLDKAVAVKALKELQERTDVTWCTPDRELAADFIPYLSKRVGALYYNSSRVGEVYERRLSYSSTKDYFQDIDIAITEDPKEFVEMVAEHLRRFPA